MFQDMFPTPTAGPGTMVPSNRRNGANQGRPSTRKRVYCGICGWPGVDLSRDSNTKGDLMGDGAGGVVTKSSGVGDQAYRRGGGCQLCFSSNYLGRKMRGPDRSHRVPKGFTKY